MVDQGSGNWYLILKTSGTLTFDSSQNVDFFAIGGGGGSSTNSFGVIYKGQNGSNGSYAFDSSSYGSTRYGASGGGGAAGGWPADREVSGGSGGSGIMIFKNH